MPTHLILVHCAYQRELKGLPWTRLPSLTEAIQLYETVGTMRTNEGILAPRVVGIALNTGHLNAVEAQQALDEAANETGLPVTDVVRNGAQPLLNAVL